MTLRGLLALPASPLPLQAHIRRVAGLPISRYAKFQGWKYGY